MKPRDILGLIIRVAGLCIAALACYGGFYAIMEQIGLLPNAQIPAYRHAIFAFSYFIFAIVIIRMADRIVKFAYKESQNPPQGSSPDSTRGA